MALPGQPVVYNLTLTLANTEYSQALTSSTTETTRKVMAQCRTSDDVRLAFVSGETATNYFTIKADRTYWDDHISTTRTLYFRSATAGVIVEILEWVGS